VQIEEAGDKSACGNANRCVDDHQLVLITSKMNREKGVIMNWHVYEGVRAAALTLEKLIAALKGKKNPEETGDASFGKDKATNYNEKFLAFIKAFANIGAARLLRTNALPQCLKLSAQHRR